MIEIAPAVMLDSNGSSTGQVDAWDLATVDFQIQPTDLGLFTGALDSIRSK